jgi:hypothetical protein
MTAKKKESTKEQFKKAKTKKKKPAAKKEKPYTGGSHYPGRPGQWKPDPNWKERW